MSPFCVAHYFSTIVDYKSRAMWVYMMRNKGEMSKLVQHFVLFVKNQFDKNVKNIHSDNRAEFTSNPLK